MRFFLGVLLATSLAGVVAGGIYPDGHFTRSHELTTSNFDEIVKNEVDAGKTLFVRWIASEG